jgi:hypothetical protein
MKVLTGFKWIRIGYKGGFRCTGGYKIKMELIELDAECVDWIQMDQGRAHVGSS